MTQIPGVTIFCTRFSATPNTLTAPNLIAADVTPNLGVANYADIDFNFDESVAYQYQGQYRMFVRGYVTAGALGNSTMEVFSTSLNLQTPTKYVPITPGGIVDFGVVNLPFSRKFSGYHTINIRFTDTASAGLTFRFYDLIILPVDEWMGLLVPSYYDPVTGRAIYAAEPITLYANGLKYKDRKYSVVLTESLKELYLGEYDDIICNAKNTAVFPPILQANVDQKLWFFQVCDLNGVFVAYGHDTLAIQLIKQQRYLTMRGDR
jgi:hypothetical protein